MTALPPLIRRLEALIFAANRPLSLTELGEAVKTDPDRPDLLSIEGALHDLAACYQDSAVALKQVASGYRFQVRQDYATWAQRSQDSPPPTYSQALLETLAVIAYRQPVTRQEIEDLRGVSLNPGLLDTLIERGWIKVIGETTGQAQLWATTRQFLDYFNLTSLDELPSLEAWRIRTK